MTKIYTLQLQKGKYYVGKTENIGKRFEEHNSGNGCIFTRIYKPIKIIETFELKSQFDEDIQVKKMMLKYGIENVRGGSYSSQYLSEEELFCLEKELFSAKDRCYNCGEKGHFSKDCDYDSESDSDNDVICYRCGRDGHISPECYAKYHVKGYRLY